MTSGKRPVIREGVPVLSPSFCVLSVLLPHGTSGDVWYVGVYKHLEALCALVLWCCSLLERRSEEGYGWDQLMTAVEDSCHGAPRW